MLQTDLIRVHLIGKSVNTSTVDSLKTILMVVELEDLSLVVLLVEDSKMVALLLVLLLLLGLGGLLCPTETQ